MKIQIRLAESGHSHCYNDIPNLEILMLQIKKDFKIQLLNQKILNKSCQLLKKQTNFDSVKDQMKKTLASYNNNLNTNLNNSQNCTSAKKQIGAKKQIADSQINQCPCLYIYNQKQLLKPIQYTSEKNRQYFINVLKEKSEQMFKLRENSYQWNQFKQKFTKKNLQSIIESVGKKFKLLLQNVNIQQKYWNFLQDINKCKQLNFQVSQLANLCESQCRAGKTIIRSINVVNHQKCKKKLQNINKKLDILRKSILPQDQINFKQNSVYFNTNKKHSIQSISISSIVSKKEQIDKKFVIGEDKYKKSKKTYVAEKHKFGQKKCYQISGLSQKLKFSMQQSSRSIKQSYTELFEELQRYSKKEKQQKESVKLNTILQKISIEEQKILKIIQQYTQFYIQLSEIHNYNQRVEIKETYSTYIALRKYFDEFQDQLKDFEREIHKYIKQKQQIYKSQENQELSSEMVEAGKNQQKKERGNIKQKQKQSTQSPIKDISLTQQQKQNNLPKVINSPAKKKIAKNNIKYPFKQFYQNANIQFSQIQEIDRRLFFKRRLKNIIRFCQNLQKEEEKRRKKYNNTKSHQNSNRDKQSIQLLKNITTPLLVMDYDNSTDLELEQQRKMLLAGNQHHQNLDFQQSLSWQQQVIESISCVNLQLNIYMATTKYDKSQKQKDLQKLLELSTGLITKMCKKKVSVEKQQLKKQLKFQYEEQLIRIKRQNEQLNSYIISLKQSIQNSEGVIIQKSNANQQGQKSSSNICHSSLQRFFQIQKNANYIAKVNQEVQAQNKQLKDEIVQLNINLFKYQQEIDQITNQLSRMEQTDHQVQLLKQQIQLERISKDRTQQEIQRLQHLLQSQKSIHSKQVEQFKHHLNMQKQSAFTLKKQIKDLNSQIKEMKKFLNSHQKIIETLEAQYMNVNTQKQVVQKQFLNLKIFLADRQVQIIRLEQHIKNIQSKDPNLQSQQEFSGKYFQGDAFVNQSDPQIIKKLQLESSFYGQKRLSPIKGSQNNIYPQFQAPTCKCSQAIIQSIKCQNEQLKLQIQSLQKQLRQMLMKQTFQQQTQTDRQAEQSNRAQKNEELQINYESHYYQHYESEQKWNPKQMHHVHQNQNYPEDRIISQSSYQKIRSYSNTNLIRKLTVSKSIEEGNLHLFLPFANDIYIGVTIRQDENNFTSYQQYINRATTEVQPVYQLDLNSMNKKINQLLRQSSLVLAVRVSKIQQKEEGRQGVRTISVSGKIEYAMGFQDQERSIKNYAPFLYQ